MASQTPSTARQAIVSDLAVVLHGFDRGEVHGLSAFGTTDRDEIQARETGALFMLLLLHRVDERGRCRRCRPARTGKRRWPNWPSRKAPCQVLKVITFFSSAPLDEVWLRLLPRLGVRREFREIRANLANQSMAAGLAGTMPIPAQVDGSGRHALCANDITI